VQFRGFRGFRGLVDALRLAHTEVCVDIGY